MGRKSNKIFILAKIGRRLVQLSFLLLFLFPLIVIVYKKASFGSAPTFTSWLLIWDPAVLIAQLLNHRLSNLVIGAPLLLLALSFIFGRFFCGWICPMGTLQDLVRSLVFWQKYKSTRSFQGWFPARRNRKLRYLILAAILGTSLFSIKYIGLLDPLVIFQRSTTTLAANYFSVQQPGIRATIGLVSLIFLAILALEFWQPRFWCRNLCPLGALISLISRYSLFKRQVNTDECTHCNLCSRSCPMNAIPKQAFETDYSQCTFCLECTSSCPQDGIHFSIGNILQVESPLHQNQAHSDLPLLDRRAFIGTTATVVAGLALTPLIELEPRKTVLRPPRALPEAQFIRACIACQECIRVCPTNALHPALMESGLAGIGTPILVPRQGGCALNPSCPDLCARVCPVGAIQPITKDKIKIGLAKVHREACLAWDQNAKCLVCVEACLNSAAIAFEGRVTVDPNLCTGCGRCESGCPVPGSAIRVEPIEQS